MLYLEEKNYRDIGEIIGISEKNVSVRLVRLKDKLRKLIGSQ
jgi:RNA polymerase sigma-70 factor (ECF subfamily)